MGKTRSNFMLGENRVAPKIRHFFACCSLALLAGALAACTTSGGGGAQPVVAQMPTADSVISTQTEQLSPAEISSITGTQTDGAYVLGPNDVISIDVYMHPELDVPAANAGGNLGGALISSDGSVQLPLIGGIHLGGMTLAQAQTALTQTYAKYINNAQVSVEMQQAQSLRYYLLGAFASPGIKYPMHPLTLLDALALGGSVNIADADLYQAYVAHDEVKLPIDLHALLVEGDLTQNITLASGDIIVIPSSANEDAFVFGAITKPGPVQFQSGGLSLLQALSSAGLDLPSMTNGQLSQIHIIRSGAVSAQFIVVNANMIMNGKAASFALQPGDIVYVPATAIASWNQVLTELLPSLQTVGAVLNPFVSIKYLSQRNN